METILKPYKLTLAIIGGQTTLSQALAPLGHPFEHKTLSTDDGTMHMFTWIYEELEHARAHDHLAQKCLDDFGFMISDYDIKTFVSKGPTWERLVLLN